MFGVNSRNADEVDETDMTLSRRGHVNSSQLPEVEAVDVVEQERPVFQSASFKGI